MDMLQTMNSSVAGCETRISDDLNSILAECSASFRKWAEGVLSSGGDSTSLGRESDSHAPRRQHNGRLSLDVLKAKMMSHSNPNSFSLETNCLRVQLNPQKSKSFSIFQSFQNPKLGPTIEDNNGGEIIKAIGEDDDLLDDGDEEIAHDGINLRALNTILECRRDALVTKRETHQHSHQQLIRVDNDVEAAWGKSSTLFSSAASPRGSADAVNNAASKRRKELRLVIPPGENPLELPRPNALTSKVSPSGKAEAFLLKQMYDLEVS